MKPTSSLNFPVQFNEPLMTYGPISAPPTKSLSCPPSELHIFESQIMSLLIQDVSGHTHFKDSPGIVSRAFLFVNTPGSFLGTS